MSTWRNALSFAVTVVIFYALCTLLAVSFPSQFVGFMNALFHGLDFQVLQRQAAFEWTGFCYAAAVMFIWALGFGAFFAVLKRWLGTPSSQ
jgi:hypothetical protein